MWTAMVIVGFIVMVIFLVVGVISAIRKNGKAKKQLLTSVAGVLLLLVGAFNVGDVEQTTATDDTTTKVVQATEIDRYKQYATRLRGGSFLKSAEIEGNSGSIEILASYEEFKKLEPASTIEEKQFNDYWNTGDAINKTLMEEPVRLLREFPELQKVDFTILSVGKTYTVELDRETAEQYFKVNLKDLHEDKSLDKWREQISAKYFTPEERAKYVEQFVKVK